MLYFRICYRFDFTHTLHIQSCILNFLSLFTLLFSILCFFRQDYVDPEVSYETFYYSFCTTHFALCIIPYFSKLPFGWPRESFDTEILTRLFSLRSSYLAYTHGRAQPPSPLLQKLIASYFFFSHQKLVASLTRKSVSSF